MPDLATHALSGLALYRLSGARLDPTLLLVGSLLPDVVAWLPMKIAARLVPYGLPPETVRYCPPMHSIAAVAIWSLLLGALFVRGQRRLAAASLMVASLVHLLLDILQYKFDGGYLALYPITMERVQIGLIRQDLWYAWIPAGVLLVLALEAPSRIASWRQGRGAR